MKPKGVMVWMGVGFDAKAPLICVKAGVKINTDVYRKEILEPVEQWAEQHYGVDENGKLFKFDSQLIFRLLERLDFSARRRAIAYEHQ